MNILPVFSTIITFAFVVAVLQRYKVRRGTHLLMWSIGLALYGLGTLTEVLLSLNFSQIALKVWYIAGAMLTAAWLGQGTLHLLVRRANLAWILTAILAAVSFAAVLLVLVAPLSNPGAYQVSQPVSTQYKDILARNGAITALTVLLNIYGTITMVGGALFSAYLFWRKQVMLNRVLGNVLIAAGALAPAMAGSFVKAGLVDELYVSELIGAILMFVGFWLSTSKAAVAATSQAPTTR